MTWKRRPGIDRADSFFARTVPSSQDAARLYLGITAQGRGPKLVFLRALTTLLAAAQAAYDASAAASPPGKSPADSYMTALCYFNALRELEDVGLAVRGAPISQNADWLPAIEQFGEGIFLHFDEAAVRAWLDGEGANARHEKLYEGYLHWAKRFFGHPPKYPGTPYVLLHSLSHALITEIALDCGYPAMIRCAPITSPTTAAATVRPTEPRITDVC
jgi:hypothetical protein